MLHVRADGLADLTVRDLPSLLREGDLMVFNDTRVIKARLLGMKASTAFESLPAKAGTVSCRSAKAPARSFTMWVIIVLQERMDEIFADMTGVVSTTRFTA